MFGRSRRREQRERLLQRVGDLEVELRDVIRPAIQELEDRPALPVEEIREARAALAGKVNRAIEHHTHENHGLGAGEIFKPQGGR